MSRLVVSGLRWGLADGRRGVVDTDVVRTAVGLGAEVVYLIGTPLPRLRLWNADTDQVEETGTEDTDGAGAWRYRVTIPGGKPVHLVVVDRDGGQWAGPWAGLDGTELLGVFRVLESYGVPWSHSVSRTAESLILATHPRRRGGRTLDRSPEVPGPAASTRLEDSWTSWSRPLSDVERGRAYVHTFDANAAYLGCWQTVELGFGTPEHLPTADHMVSTDTERPGVWRVELPTGWHEPAHLPPIAPGLRHVDGRGLGGWVMTPTLDRLGEWADNSGQGEVVPVEGYAWPERSRYLRAAGERLRDARASAVEAGRQAQHELTRAQTEEEATAALRLLVTSGAVKDAVRDLYTITTGRLGSNHQHAASAWHRPDWANTIRAQWRANMHRRLAVGAAVASPFAIATDAVAYATDQPDPAAFAASLGLRLGDGLGQWKVQGSTTLAAVLPGLEHGGRHAVSSVFTTAASS